MLKKVLITLLSIILVVLFASPSSSAKYITNKSNSKLVDLRDIDRTIVIDLRYATKNNFTKKQIYTDAIPLLRKETAIKSLQKPHELIRK